MWTGIQLPSLRTCVQRLQLGKGLNAVCCRPVRPHLQAHSLGLAVRAPQPRCTQSPLGVTVDRHTHDSTLGLHVDMHRPEPAYG